MPNDVEMSDPVQRSGLENEHNAALVTGVAPVVPSDVLEYGADTVGFEIAWDADSKVENRLGEQPGYCSEPMCSTATMRS